ncbi:MAG: hypothetical protein P8Z80_21190, partial [Pseudolabrys sp.]
PNPDAPRILMTELGVGYRLAQGDGETNNNASDEAASADQPEGWAFAGRVERGRWRVPRTDLRRRSRPVP